jgi:hypothetical protein
MKKALINPVPSREEFDGRLHALHLRKLQLYVEELLAIQGRLAELKDAQGDGPSTEYPTDSQEYAYLMWEMNTTDFSTERYSALYRGMVLLKEIFSNLLYVVSYKDLPSDKAEKHRTAQVALRVICADTVSAMMCDVEGDTSSDETQARLADMLFKSTHAAIDMIEDLQHYASV